MDRHHKRLVNEALRARARALARGDVRAAHACNQRISEYRRAAREVRRAA